MQAWLTWFCSPWTLPALFPGSFRKDACPWGYRDAFPQGAGPQLGPSPSAVSITGQRVLTRRFLLLASDPAHCLSSRFSTAPPSHALVPTRGCLPHQCPPPPSTSNTAALDSVRVLQQADVPLRKGTP